MNNTELSWAEIIGSAITVVVGFLTLILLFAMF